MREDVESFDSRVAGTGGRDAVCRIRETMGWKRGGVPDDDGWCRSCSGNLVRSLRGLLEKGILKPAGFVDQFVELFPVSGFDHFVAYLGREHVDVAEGSFA